MAAAFFVSRWAINAPGLGAHDAGLALGLSFGGVLCLYACGVLCVLAVFASAFAALGRRPWRAFAWAALPAALPFLFLAIVGWRARAGRRARDVPGHAAARGCPSVA